MVTETVRTLNWEIELRMQRSWLHPWPWPLCSVLRQHNFLSPTINMQGYRKIVGEIKVSTEWREGREMRRRSSILFKDLRESSNILTRFLLTKSGFSNEIKLYIILSYLDLARPWASSSTVGTPRRTNLVKRDCSMLENFWKAIFFITGGSCEQKRDEILCVL